MCRVTSDSTYDSTRAFPGLLWPIVFRLVITASFCVFAIPSVEAVRSDGILVFAVVYGVLPSLIIAAGLWWRQRWAAWLAIVGDCSIAPLGLGAFASALLIQGVGPPPDPMDRLWSVWFIVLAVVSLAEGIYLLRKLGQNWMSLVAYVPPAAAFLYIGVLFGSIAD